MCRNTSTSGSTSIDAWANKDRNKLAMIWVNQEGVEKKFTFWDLMRLSNQIVNMHDQVRGQQGRPGPDHAPPCP